MYKWPHWKNVHIYIEFNISRQIYQTTKNTQTMRRSIPYLCTNYASYDWSRVILVNGLFYGSQSHDPEPTYQRYGVWIFAQARCYGKSINKNIPKYNADVESFVIRHCLHKEGISDEIQRNILYIYIEFISLTPMISCGCDY